MGGEKEAKLARRNASWTERSTAGVGDTELHIM
jgi:hypothetical protein